MTALDTNGDGTIDESELKNAAASLKKLDKNGDGKLSDEEMRPTGMGGGRGGFGGQGGGRQQGGQAGQAGQPGEGMDLTARLMQNDKNADGKLSKDELPERMQAMFGSLDKNSDGFLDKTELQAIAQQMRDRGQQRGGGDGQRPSAEGGDSKSRPQRPPSE
jgi:Ca2+-binding EF-hand superfamily protein